MSEDSQLKNNINPVDMEERCAYLKLRDRINLLKQVHDHFRGEQPFPPNQYLKTADHHWLEVRTPDGNTYGLVVLQWNPGVQKWSHSGDYATGYYIDATSYRYIAHCPLPVLY